MGGRSAVLDGRPDPPAFASYRPFDHVREMAVVIGSLASGGGRCRKRKEVSPHSGSVGVGVSACALWRIPGASQIQNWITEG